MDTNDQNDRVSYSEPSATLNSPNVSQLAPALVETLAQSKEDIADSQATPEGTERTDDTPRWDNNFTQILLGAFGASKSVPAPDSREAKNAHKWSGVILEHEQRLFGESSDGALIITSELVERFYCNNTERWLMKFPHQNLDNFDPGYRLIKAVSALNNLVRNAMTPDVLDLQAFKKLADEMTAFNQAHGDDTDARFKPVASFARFLTHLANRLTSYA